MRVDISDNDAANSPLLPVALQDALEDALTKETTMADGHIAYFTYLRVDISDNEAADNSQLPVALQDALEDAQLEGMPDAPPPSPQLDKEDSIHVVHYEKGQRREHDIGWGAAGAVDLEIMVVLPCRVFILGGTGVCCHPWPFRGRACHLRPRSEATFNTSFDFRTVVNYPQEHSCYNASKAGVVQLTKSLTAEWARHQIRVPRSA